MKRRIAQILITVALFLLLGWYVDVPSALAKIGRIDPTYGFAALVLLFLQNDLVTRRWTTMLRAFVTPPGHLRMLRAQYAALFAQLFLPASVGSAIVRVGMLYRDGVAIGIAANSVVLDRLVAAAGLVLLATVFLPIAALPLSLGEDARRYGFMGFLILASNLLFGFVALKWRPLSFWLSLLNRTPARHAVEPAMGAARELTRPSRLIAALTYSLAGQLITIGAVFTLARGAGLDVHLLDCILVMPPVMLIASLPISIAGWGVREGAMIVAFGLLGTPREAALALSLKFAIVGYIAALPGVFVWLSETKRAMLSKFASRHDEVKPKVADETD